MRSRSRRLAAAAVLALCTACASGASSRASSPRTDRNVLTQAQLVQNGYTNALEAVQALRSNWLLTKGVDSFQSPGQVQVYHDDSRLGGVETLRWIPTSDVVYIRYYDPITASSRWGLDHGHGVIYVSSRPLRTGADSVGRPL